MDLKSVYILDLVVVGFLLLSAVVAYLRGFVREALSLLAWIGAGIATYYLFEPLKGYVRAFVPIPLFADIATGLAVFVVALLILSFVAGRIADGVAKSSQSALDRALGFLFGLFRGALLVCLAYLVVSWVIPPAEQPGWLREARTTPLVRDGARELERLVPPEIAAESRLATRRAGESVRGAAEAERLLDRLNNPALVPPAQRVPETEVGYGEQQRRELERLIRGTQ